MDKYENIKVAFESLIKNSYFQELVLEYRHRFGIPINGFSDLASDEYINWINEGGRKLDYLKDQFLFLAKRCKNLAPDRDPIPLTVIAYYFLFNKKPSLSSGFNEFLFSIQPSGILGSLDITFTVPLLFDVNNLLAEVEKHKVEITQTSVNAKLAISNLSTQATSSNNFDPNKDLLATTPGNGGDIVDRVHRDMAYLAEFGRIILREHLSRLKDDDFVITKYDDKNKPISAPVQQMGMWLLNRGLFPIAEGYWRNIEDEIDDFSNRSGKKINKGIPLANQGVSQIAQGKVVEGLFNIYRGYEDDRDCLKHLSGASIDPEKDMADSNLYTQFEQRQITNLFNTFVSKYGQVFHTNITSNDLTLFVKSLQSDKKLLLFMIIYRFSFASSLNNQLTNLISRSEILRSLAELALWCEDEFKRKDTSLVGLTLIQILDNKLGQPLNPQSGQFTKATSLDELVVKIYDAITATSNLEMKNARITGCLRNFAGHNLDVKDHQFFQTSDEVFARILSFIIYSKAQNWI